MINFNVVSNCVYVHSMVLVWYGIIIILERPLAQWATIKPPR